MMVRYESFEFISFSYLFQLDMSEFNAKFLPDSISIMVDSHWAYHKKIEKKQNFQSSIPTKF